CASAPLRLGVRRGAVCPPPGQPRGVETQKSPTQRMCWIGLFRDEAGDDVLSHTVSGAVPSALRGLTSVFGMGTGVSLAPLPPDMSSGRLAVRTALSGSAGRSLSQRGQATPLKGSRATLGRPHDLGEVEARQ